MQQYQLGIFIGRFQPFHDGHHYVIDQAFKRCKELLILVGSSYRARTVKNPFTFDERKKLIEENLCVYDQKNGTDYAKRTTIKPIEDQMYNDQRWISLARGVVDSLVSDDASIAIIGHDKDKSTYYLKLFKNWALVSVGNYQGVNATELRHAYFSGLLFNNNTLLAHLPLPSQAFLKAFSQCARFDELKAELAFLDQYKASWADSPYPPTFITADSVVVCQDHLLLIQRGHHPGQGLWAIPGGFLEIEEWVNEAIIRELLEETNIAVNQDTLKAALKTVRVFDHPKRSLIGRVVTHAGLFVLDGKLPGLSPEDDAEKAVWVPLAEVEDYKQRMHDDHYYIIQSFLQNELEHN